ncbi:MAG: TAXI family TRAP transporter solute-binding subunit [Eubacteriales bacterium]|nr:TAXI family TRAP transporter solute-binding subunit [Eubacteriales bacterium]
MKRLFSLLIATVMVLSLAACGSKPAATDTAAAGAQQVDTNTVAIGAVVIARDDIPEDEIYTLVSTIFENKDAITSQHAKGNELDLAFASSITSVPYHPGAAKYFKEKGIDVAAVKEGAGVGEKKDLNFGTGGEAGTYYAYGGVLSTYVSGNTDIKVTALTSGGSKSNIEDLTAGNIQLGFTQSDVMAYAYNGERLFEEKVEGFSVVCSLYMEQVQIVTTNPDIKTVADLKGKNVSIGASGSGTYFNAIDALSAYDLTESDIKPVFQSFGDSVESLKDKKIDAAFIVAGAPTTAITDLATAKPVYLVGFDEEHINKLVASSPYYSSYTIKAGTY